MDSNQDQKQLDKRARILARAERAKAKLDGNESELSLPIRIQQSTLYDWKPAFRAVLFTISFMRVQGDSPFARPKPRQNWKGSYEGWCWASQETLAMRAGCSERWVQEAVRRFKADGIIEERYWRDRCRRQGLDSCTACNKQAHG